MQEQPSHHLSVGERNPCSPFSMRFWVNKCIVALSRDPGKCIAPGRLGNSQRFMEQRRKCASRLSLVARREMRPPACPHCRTAAALDGLGGAAALSVQSPGEHGDAAERLLCVLAVTLHPRLRGGAGTVTRFTEKRDSANSVGRPASLCPLGKTCCAVWLSVGPA